MADEQQMQERNSRLEGKWEDVRGRIREAWGALTDDDVDRSKGNWSQLVGTIRERTGEKVDDIENKLNDMLDRVEEAGSPDEEKKS